MQICFIYASLIPGSLLYSSDSEGDIDPVAVDDPQVFETNTALSLQEILEQLVLKINDDKISKFNISRSHLWEGALRGLSLEGRLFLQITGCQLSLLMILERLRAQLI